MLTVDPKIPIPLHLDVAVAARIASHLSAAYPLEACGVLIGSDSQDGRRVVDAIPVENAWPTQSEKARRFILDPQHQLRIERSLDGTGKSLIGFYHSHPDHPAEPSAFDLEAAWATYSYLIVRVSRDGAQEMRSWLLDDAMGRFIEQRVEQRLSDSLTPTPVGSDPTPQESAWGRDVPRGKI